MTMPDPLRETIAAARSRVVQLRKEALQRINRLECEIIIAENNARAGNLDGAREAIQCACDLEYDLTGDCEASGAVADALRVPVERETA